MLTAIFAFFSGPWGIVAKLALVTALIGGIWLHGRHDGVKSMEPKVQAAESNAALWQQTADNRLKLMQAQNTAVAALKQAQETKLVLMKDKLAKVEKEAIAWRKKADEKTNTLLNMKLSDDECTALKQLVDESMQ